MPGLLTVYQLQAADLERADVARRLQEAERALGETPELVQARAAVENEEQSLKRLRAQERDMDLEIKSLSGKITATEQRLYSGQVRNPKELEDLQADLRFLRSRRETLEDQLLSTIAEADEGQQTLQQTTQKRSEVERQWQESQAVLRARIDELRSQLAQLEERVASLRSALPAPLLAEYEEACRKKGGRGIAAIRRGMCEGCRVTVPTSVVQQVRRGPEMVRCNSCGRILCVVE